MNEDKSEKGKFNHGREQAGPRPASLDEWSDEVEDVIAEAMREGLFDDLPGQGKPLKLPGNPYAAEAELAYQLLKDNNYTLPWIAERAELLDEIQTFRRELLQTWTRYQAEFQVSQGEMIRMGLSVGWHRYLTDCQARITRLNKAVSDLNLKQPGEKMEIFKLVLDSELKRIDAGRELG